MTRQTSVRAARAFTLIELLVVVAIISILAAIAVPNFTDALVRAKVSAAMANIRTLATGVESYQIDQGKFPPALFDSFYLHGIAPGDELFPWMLTTPVQYLNGTIQDPFAPDGAEGRYHKMSSVFYQAHPETSPASYYPGATVGTGFTMDADHYSMTGHGGTFHTPLFPWEYWTRYSYGIASLGPDLTPSHLVPARLHALEPEMGWAAPFAVIHYDPTNGTRSGGNIYYYGPGGGFNSAPQPSDEDSWNSATPPWPYPEPD